MASPSPEDAAAEERHGVIQPITAYSGRLGLQVSLSDPQASRLDLPPNTGLYSFT